MRVKVKGFRTGTMYDRQLRGVHVDVCRPHSGYGKPEIV